MKALHDQMPVHTSNSSPSAPLPVHFSSALLLVLKILHIISLLELWNLLSPLPVKFACALHIAGFFRSQYECHILKEEVSKELIKKSNSQSSLISKISLLFPLNYCTLSNNILFILFTYILFIFHVN